MLCVLLAFDEDLQARSRSCRHGAVALEYLGGIRHNSQLLGGEMKLITDNQHTHACLSHTHVHTHTRTSSLSSSTLISHQDVSPSKIAAVVDDKRSPFGKSKSKATKNQQPETTTQTPVVRCEPAEDPEDEPQHGGHDGEEEAEEEDAAE